MLQPPSPDWEVAPPSPPEPVWDYPPDETPLAAPPNPRSAAPPSPPSPSSTVIIEIFFDDLPDDLQPVGDSYAGRGLRFSREQIVVSESNSQLPSHQLVSQPGRRLLTMPQGQRMSSPLLSSAQLPIVIHGCSPTAGT